MKKTFDVNLKGAISCIVLILIIIALSASSIGWKVEKQAVESIKLSDVVITKLEGEPYGIGPGVPVYTITVTNTFFPRQYLLPNAIGCLYNTELKKTSYVDLRWDSEQQQSELGIPPSSLEVIKGTKTAKLLVYQGIRYKPLPAAVAVPEKVQEEEVYDQLLLFMAESGKLGPFVDCYGLKETDFEKAIKIEVVK